MTIDCDSGQDLHQVGARLRLLLALRQLSPSRLADIMGVARPTVSLWLKGRSFTFDALAQLSQVLDLSMNWLLLGAGEPDLVPSLDLNEEEESMVLLMRHLKGNVGESSLQFFSNLESTVRQHQEASRPAFLNHHFDATQTGIAMLTTTFQMRKTNLFLRRLLGLGPDDIHAGVPTLDHIISPGYRRTVMDAMKSTLVDGRTDYFYCELRHVLSQAAIPAVISAFITERRHEPAVVALVKPVAH